MKYSNLFLALLTVFLFFGTTVSIAQPVAMFQYRHVPDDKVTEFLHREMSYWSKVARKAIDDGKMQGWELWQKVGGWDMPGGSNYVFVNYFEKPEDLDHLNEIWGIVTELFPDMSMSLISTNGLSTLNHQLVMRGVAGEGLMGEAPAPYLRVNYAKASNMGQYLELEQETWQPFIKQAMESGKTTQKSWRLGALVMPTGTDLPFNAMTADGYEKMSEALFPGTSFAEEVQFPDLSALNKVHKKVYIQLYSLVASEQ